MVLVVDKFRLLKVENAPDASKLALGNDVDACRRFFDISGGIPEELKDRDNLELYC